MVDSQLDYAKEIPNQTPVAVDANEQRAKIKEDVDKDVVPSRFLASTFQGARYMLLQQLMTRGLTFALNMFLIRISPVELLGVVDKLDLLMSTVLLYLERAFVWPFCVTLWPPIVHSYQ
ncbi:hypothetical protein BASA60_001638 [Batrachochytrium salamandrivorans]|nr:hypothetical protein BASA60_001638 [Batrachochytrium salamandrivorans]